MSYDPNIWHPDTEQLNLSNYCILAVEMLSGSILYTFCQLLPGLAALALGQYLSWGVADRHETKGMKLNMMLKPLYNLDPTHNLDLGQAALRNGLFERAMNRCNVGPLYDLDL